MKYFIGTLSECQEQQNLNDTCMNLPYAREKVAKTFAEPDMIDNPSHEYFGSYVIAICPMRETQVSPLFDYSTDWFYDGES